MPPALAPPSPRAVAQPARHRSQLRAEDETTYSTADEDDGVARRESDATEAGAAEALLMAAETSSAPNAALGSLLCMLERCASPATASAAASATLVDAATSTGA